MNNCDKTVYINGHKYKCEFTKGHRGRHVARTVVVVSWKDSK